MKYTKLTIALFAIVALAGCSSFGGTQEPVATAAPVVVEETTSRIAIGTLLDKLNTNGCTVGKFTYREVNRGAHVEILCEHNDDLSLDTDL